MFKRFLCFALALSLAIPMPVSASNSSNSVGGKETSTPEITPLGEGQSDDVINLSIGQGQVVNQPLIAEDAKYTSSVWVSDYEILEGKLPVGLHIAGGQKEYSGRVKIVGTPTQRVVDSVVRIRVNIQSTTSAVTAKQKDITINITSNDNVTANPDVYFTQTTPDNILLTPGQTFSLTDVLSDGSAPVYFTDKVHLKEDHRALHSYWRYNSTRSESLRTPNEDNLYKFYVDDVLKTNYGKDLFENQVIKVENGKITAVAYGSAIIWVADANYSVVKPIVINVRDSAAKIKAPIPFYNGNGRLRPISSFVETGSLEKSYTDNNLFLMFNHRNFYRENIKGFELYSDGYLNTADIYDLSTYELEGKKINNFHTSLAIGSGRSYVVGEMFLTAKVLATGQYSHNDRFFYVLRNTLQKADHDTAPLLVGSNVNLDLNTLVKGGVGKIRFTSDSLPGGLSIDDKGILKGTINNGYQNISVVAIDEWGSSVTINRNIVVDNSGLNIVTKTTGEGTGYIDINTIGVESGDSRVINAIPSTGSFLTALSVNDAAHANNTAYTFSGDTEIVAEFAKSLYLKTPENSNSLTITDYFGGGKSPYNYSLMNNNSVASITNGVLSFSSNNRDVLTQIKVTDSLNNEIVVSLNIPKPEEESEPSIITLNNTTRVVTYDLGLITTEMSNPEFTFNDGTKNYSSDNVKAKIDGNTLHIYVHKAENTDVPEVIELNGIDSSNKKVKFNFNVNKNCPTKVSVKANDSSTLKTAITESNNGYTVNFSGELADGYEFTEWRYTTKEFDFDTLSYKTSPDYMFSLDLSNTLNLDLYSSDELNIIGYTKKVNSNISVELALTEESLASGTWEGAVVDMFSIYVNNVKLQLNDPEHEFSGSGELDILDNGRYMVAKLEDTNGDGWYDFSFSVMNTSTRDSFSSYYSIPVIGELVVNDLTIDLSDKTIGDVLEYDLDDLVPDSAERDPYYFIGIGSEIPGGEYDYDTRELRLVVNEALASQKDVTIRVDTSYDSIYSKITFTGTPKKKLFSDIQYTIDYHNLDITNRGSDSAPRIIEINLDSFYTSYKTDFIGIKLDDVAASSLDITDLANAETRIITNSDCEASVGLEYASDSEGGYPKVVLTTYTDHPTLNRSYIEVGIKIPDVPNEIIVPIELFEADTVDSLTELTAYSSSKFIDIDLASMVDETLGNSHGRPYTFRFFAGTDDNNWISQTSGYLHLTSEGKLTGEFLDKSSLIDLEVIDRWGNTSSLRLDLTISPEILVEGTSSTGGSYTGLDEATLMLSNSSISVTAVADEGYVFDHWLVDYYSANSYNAGSNTFTYARTDDTEQQRVLTETLEVKGLEGKNVHKIMFTPVFVEAAKMSLTNMSLEVNSPDWSILHDLEQYVQDYVEPLTFSVTDEDLSLGVTNKNKLVGYLDEDTQVPIRVQDLTGITYYFTLDVKVPESVTIIINHNNEQGTVEDISEDVKVKVGDIIAFSTPANSGYKHVKTSINDDVFQSEVIEEYEVADPVLEITTEYKEAMTLQVPDDDKIPVSEWIVGGKPPITYEKISGPEQIKLGADLDLYVEGELATGIYEVGIRATDSTTPDPQVVEFIVPFNYAAEEADWCKINIENTIGGYVQVEADLMSYRNGRYAVPNGEEITVTAIPYEGYEFDRWLTSDDTEASITLVVDGHKLFIPKFKVAEAADVDPVDTMSFTKDVVELVYPEGATLSDITTGGAAPYRYTKIMGNSSLYLSTLGEIVADEEVTPGEHTLLVKVVDSDYVINFLPITVKVYKDVSEFNVLIPGGEDEEEPFVQIPDIYGWTKPFTYEKVSGHEKITVDSATGLITVDKTLPGGDYTLEVKITDSSTPAKEEVKSYTLRIFREAPELILPEDGVITVLIPREPQIPVWPSLNDFIKGLHAPFTYEKVSGPEGIDIVDGKIVVGDGVENGNYTIVVRVSGIDGKSKELEIPVKVERLKPFTVSYTVRPNEGGEAVVTSIGGVVTVEATANEGYSFTKFVVGETNVTENPYSFTPSGDTQIDVIFTKDMTPNSNTSANQGSDGSVNIDTNDFFDGGIPPYTYAFKEPVDGLSIDANTGIITGTVGEEGATIIVVITDSSNPPVVKEITITINPLGKIVPIINITGQGTVATDKEYYLEGDKATFTATAAEGYLFKHFIFDGNTLNGNQITMDVIGDITLEAVFEKAFTLRQLAEGENPLDLKNYIDGGEGKITFEPINLPEGFSINENSIIEIDEDKVAPGVHNLVVNATDENGNTIVITVQINIEESEQTVTLSTGVNPADAGSVSLNSYTAKVGDTITATARAYSGYQFEKWLINGKDFGSNPVDVVIEDSTNFTAIFALSNSIDLDNPQPEGTVAPTISREDDTLDLDDIISGGTGDYTIEIVEKPEEVIFDENENILINNSKDTKPITIRVTDITDEEKSVTVVIILNGYKEYTVTTNVLPEAAGTVSGNGIFRAGEMVTLTATPNEGYRFAGWATNTEDVILGEVSEESITFTMIKSDVSITAQFEEVKEGEVREGIWFVADLSHEYTRSAIKPTIKVYDGERQLREKTDYTVSYKNNKNAYTVSENSADFNPKKAPTIVLKTKGNYKGTRNIYFEIKPADISKTEGLMSIMGVTSNGKKVAVNPVLKFNGKKLSTKDFSVAPVKSEDVITKAGTYNMMLTGKGNFTGTYPFTLIVSETKTQVPMSKVTVGKVKTKPFTGFDVFQEEHTLKYQKDVPEFEKEYTLEYRKNRAVGTAEMVFTGTGVDSDSDGIVYIGQKIVTFKITGTSFAKATLEGLEKKYTYTGAPIVPQFNVVLNGTTLKNGVDYTFTVTNNVNKGKATITIIPSGEAGYTTTPKKFTFSIIAEQQLSVVFAEGVDSYRLTKLGTKPAIKVYDGDMLLEEGVDYTVSYKNNKKVATINDKKAPTVVVIGKGNYTGKNTKEFNILPTSLVKENGIRLVVADKAVSAKAGGYIQKFTIYDADGGKLGTKDYDAKSVTYTLVNAETGDKVLGKKDTAPAGSTIKVTVKGKNNYAGGELTATYKIIAVENDISKVKASIMPQQYTGDKVLITDMSQFKGGKVILKVAGEDKELVLGKDFVIDEASYTNNIKRGTAKVTITGIGNYGGSKTLSYKIGQRTFNDFWMGLLDIIK